MASFEEQVQQVVDARDIPGVILLADDAKGTFKYEKAFGPRSPTEAMDLNATFILASCTKLMTTIAVLQCVERGQIALDDPVSSILTELKEPEIITGFKEDGELKFEKAKTAITLRHLLTHTSGLGYHTMDPRYVKWRTLRGEDCFIKGWPIIPRINTPLLFEPGASWAYGTGLDWAGILVSRLNNMSLEAYMQKYIWNPLEIKNITFHQENNEEVRKNLVKMSARKGLEDPIFSLPVRSEEKVEWTDEGLYDVPIADEYGGEGAIGSATEYFRILQSILADDGVLLRSETIDEMFTPQLSEGSVKALEDFNALYQSGAFASVQNGTKITWGLGGLLFLEDYFTGRKKGTLTWSGLPNLQWTIDREAGFCALYAGNVFPFGDFASGDMQIKFEKEMYARAAKASRL